jgi:hypothetical protein
MQGKSHIYFLVDEMNRSLYADGDIVKVSGVPRPLVFTPDGWTKIEINNQRNTKYFALDRSFSVPLDFVEDGAVILKDAYYKKGVEAKVYLVILKQKIRIDRDGSGNVTGFGYYYDSFYKGEIDFSQFQHSGPKVTVNIMEGGIPKYIKANENTKYELDVDVSEARYVYMDGVRLKQKATFLLSNGALVNDLGGHTIEVRMLGNESISSINAVSEKRVKTGNATNVLWGTNQYFLLTGTQSTDITVSWNFNVYVSLASGVGAIFGTSIFLQCHVLTDSNTRYSIPGVPFGTNLQAIGGGDPLLLYNRKHNFQGSVTFTVPANARCILYMSANQNRDLTFFTYDSDGSFKIDYTYTHRPTYIKVLPPEYVFKKLIEKVTDGQYQAESIVLAANHNVSVTCGDAIRGITGSKVKTSLSDFFTSYDVQFDLGLGDISGKVKLEEKTSWIDYGNPIDLGEVKGLKVKPAGDYLYNTIKIGYPEQQYDDVNGKQEFNNTSLFTTPITRVSKELNKVSAYRGDCYGIEFTRINLEGKTTTDDKSDNDVFLIHTEPTPTAGGPGTDFYKLDRSLNATASGVLDPATVFNLFLSPKRCLERNGRLIHSLFYKLDSSKLVFQTTEKNAELKTTSPLVIEKADVLISSLLPQLFSPNLLEFETPAPVDLIEALEASPIRSFVGTYLGVPIAGIPVKVSAASETNEEQDYTLLASPSTALEPLIKISE